MNSLSIWLRCACSAVGAAAALASAHAGVPPEGDTLRVAAEAGDHGFDPANDIGVRSMQMQESVFDRLYAYDPSSMRPLLVPLAEAPWA
jgi:ABC-type oligopeptide transport system substrate-binding subunit